MSRKDTFNVVLKRAEYTAPRPVEKKRNQEWVDYDGNEKEYKNNYFGYLIDRYTGSATNGAIINGIVRMIAGKGLGAINASQNAQQYAQVKSLVKDEDIAKLAFDRKALGMCAIQVTKTAGNVTGISHFPMNTLRAGIMNDDGEIEVWHYFPDWSNKKAKDETTEIPAFGFGGQNGNEIYVIKPYVAGYDYYPPVDYMGALPYAVLEEEIGDFQINDALNGFTPTTIINFNNGIKDDKTREMVANDVEKKTTGATGKKTIVSFNSDETKRTTVEKIAMDNAPEHYSYLSEECFKKLLVGHRVTSPMLLGVRDGSDGLGNNADEIETATRLFSNLTIKPFQKEITDALEEILAVNDISLELYIKTIEPLEFIDTSGMDSETREEETGQELSEDKDALQEFIDMGEDCPEDWELVAEQEVDYDDEERLDAEVAELNTPKDEKLSLYQRIINLVSSGTARPNRKSEQDVEKEEYHYKVRYKYTGSPTPERPFCQRMMAAGKIYRKEDIIAMGNKAVNPGWGPGGANTYSIWLYKGGGDCHHKWLRQTFKIKGKRGSIYGNDSEQISTGQARREGVRVTNEPEVSMMPKDMPNNGFLKPRG